MFTWICPKCGREVPPAYTECPDCSGQTAQAAANPPTPPQQSSPQAPAAPTGPARRRPVWSDAPAGQPAAPPPPPPQPQAAVQDWPATLPPAPPSAEQPYAPVFGGVVAAPQASRKVPTWLLTILFALAFVGLVFGVYKLINRTPTKPSAVVENPAAKPGAPGNPIQRYIEISGVRFEEDPKHKEQTVVRFVLTNHSDAELTGLAGNVTIWGSTRRSEEDAEGSFNFKADMKPGESKEQTAPLTTKKKIYELPDWQNVTTDLQVTAPTG